MMKRRLYRFFGILMAVVLIEGFAHAETKALGFAIPFPEVRFEQTLSKGEQAYLGIRPRKTFSFREIKADLILVEFMSTYCINCQRQAPILNELYSSIEKDPHLKRKVKIIGIAAGNNQKEIEFFKKEFNVFYPILSDAKFDAHIAAGSPRTPFTIWVRKDARGKGVVVTTHLGLMDLKIAMDETRVVLQYNLALLKPKKGNIYEGDALKPPLTEEELTAKAKEGMEASGGKVLKIEKISLKDGDWLYVGEVDFGPRQGKLFSKLASRRAVCDICHDTFFIYTFDPGGKVIDIVPIELTKTGNLDWTEEDIKRLKGRAVGKSILKPIGFDPRVDSISGATITAALVFDSLDKAKEVYEKLRKEGYIK